MLLTMIIDLILTVMTEIGMKAMIATTTNQMIHPLWNPSLPSCWKRRHLSLDASASQSRSHLPSTIIRRMTVTPSLIATIFRDLFFNRSVFNRFICPRPGFRSEKSPIFSGRITPPTHVQEIKETGRIFKNKPPCIHTGNWV